MISSAAGGNQVDDYSALHHAAKAAASAASITVSDADWTGGPLSVSNGGTAATSASDARASLGLVIGTDVQAYSDDLTTWAGKTIPSGTVIGTSDSQTLTNKTVGDAVLFDVTHETLQDNASNPSIYAIHNNYDGGGGGSLVISTAGNGSANMYFVVGDTPFVAGAFYDSGNFAASGDIGADGYIKRSRSTNITAGTVQTQAGATLLIKDINMVANVGTDNDGVKLPFASLGMIIRVVNLDSAQNLQIWPNTSDKIDSGASNAVDSNVLAPGGTRSYLAVSSSQWLTMN